MNNDFDNLIDRLNTKPGDEGFPEPGSPENPWIGVHRMVNGQRQFYALSGAERRRAARADQRATAAEQVKGQRRYNREQRRQEFLAGTRRQQLRILQGELPVTEAMQANVENGIRTMMRKNEALLNAADRKESAEKRRSERLHDRRVRRNLEGRATNRDLLALGLL